MNDIPIERMSAENVEKFDVRTSDTQDLVASLIPLHAPWSATAEICETTER